MGVLNGGAGARAVTPPEAAHRFFQAAGSRCSRELVTWIPDKSRKDAAGHVTSLLVTVVEGRAG